MADSNNDNGNGSTIPSTTTEAAPSSPSRTRARGSSSISSRARAASLKFVESNPPSGFMAATGEVAGKAPTLADIRRGSHGSGERRPSISSSTKEAMRARAESSASRKTQPPQSAGAQSPTIHEHEIEFPTIAPPIPSAADNSKRRTRDFADIADDDDFAAQMLGRGKLSNQSYEKSGSRKKSSDAVLSAADGVDDDDSLDGLDPKPKRRSKNITAMLGEGAGNAPTSGGSKRNTRDFADMIESGEYEPGKGKLDNQAFVPGASKRASRASAYLMDGAVESQEPKTTSEKAPPSTSTAVPRSTPSQDSNKKPTIIEPNEEGYYPNGYHFPEKKTWKEATIIGLKATGKFPFSSILNFLITLYGLNVVAWGGMLFLLLCNASPAMCRLGDGRVDCNDIDSPRRIWIEIDSQILNALFCVTGFGLVPWRFRDWYFLLQWRIGKKYSGLRRLAGIHNGWFRLPGSDQLPLKEDIDAGSPIDNSNDSVPIPVSKAPSEPLTGVRASSTSLWKMDYVVWAFVWNTFLQAVLSGFMWGLNRYDRPSWSTGLFVALACIVAALGGLMQFMESKRIKKIEGIPLPDGNGNVEAGNSGPGTEVKEGPVDGRRNKHGWAFG